MDEQASFEARAVLAPTRGGLRRLAIVLPALALVATAWAGLSGPRSSDGIAVNGGIPTPPRASTAVAHAALAGAPPPPRATVRWPSIELGLHVRTVRELGPDALVDVRVVAVAGWYEAGFVTACPPESDVDLPGPVVELGFVSDAQTFCDRSGLLFASSPDAGTSGNATYRSENRFKNSDLPALAIRLRPGVVVPPAIVRTGEHAAPVVLIGRLGWPFEGCARFVTRCGRELLVDRVVSATGLARSQTTSILPGLLGPRELPSWRSLDRLTEAAIGPTGPVIMETLVDQRTLAAVDADAATIVAAAAPDAQRIWYRRALGADPTRDATRWIAIDERTGRVIGSGSFDG